MPGYRDVFASLNDAGIRYVVVGGVAVVLQGHARMTVDLDLVIDLAVEPALATLDVLADMGFRPRLPVPAKDFADPSIRAGWVSQRNLQVFSFFDPGDALREIDLFATHPVPFEDMVADADHVDLGGLDVPVASIPHLLLLKRAAGRPQDAADVVALTGLLEAREKR